MEIQNETVDLEVNQLRNLLFSDYIKRINNLENQISELKSQIQSQATYEKMTPIVELAIENSIHKNKEKMATVIFPIIGPAIKKSIQDALSSMIENIQIVIDRITSFEGLKWRLQSIATGIPVSEIIFRNVLLYRVEYIYLIHRRSAKVLRYVQAEDAVEIDKLIFSGMIQAVKSFAQDIFTANEHIKLNRLEYNQFKIILSETPLVSLVVLARGVPPPDVDQIFYNLVSDVHSSYQDALSSADPEVRIFTDCENVLKKGLIQKKKESSEKSKKIFQFKFVILAIFFLLALLVPIWKMGAHYFYKQNLQTAISEIRKLEHVLVSSEKSSDSNLNLNFTSLSANPSAIQTEVQNILLKYKVSESKLNFSFFQTSLLDVKNYNQLVENIRLARVRLESESVDPLSASTVELLLDINKNSSALKKNVVVYIEYLPSYKKSAEKSLYYIRAQLSQNQIYDYHFLRIRPVSELQKNLNLAFKLVVGN